MKWEEKESKITDIWPTLFTVLKSVRSTTARKLKNCTGELKKQIQDDGAV
jgi:hypothetical protein